MDLIKPSRDFESSWLAALREFEEEGVGGFWNYPSKPLDLGEYLKRTDDHSQGLNLPQDWPKATTFWLVQGDEFLGHVNLRHYLVEWSRRIGGHIGFAIRKSARNRGCGSRILALALEEAREIGLERALVTCNDKNVGSRKIIEKNGGVYQDTNEVKGERVRRYWIPLVQGGFGTLP